MIIVDILIGLVLGIAGIFIYEKGKKHGRDEVMGFERRKL